MDKATSEAIKTLVEEGIIELNLCSEDSIKKYEEMVKSGIALPDGIFQYETGFYLVNIKEKEIDLQMKILIRQTRLLKSIRNCVLFFTILGIIALIIVGFSLLASFR